ncbi:unnamed protein product [Hapterophycus canaliculatus]
MGKFADVLAFTAYSPSIKEVELAVGLLNPTAIEYHQEQAGFIPNGCEDSCDINAYWQLYKLKAVYRMMEDHETRTGLPYTWVIRSRLDIAWMSPMQPLGRFPQSRVYTGHNFFPIADQFFLAPRRFARTVFGAVSLCYDCKALKTQQEPRIRAQTESLLYLALRQDYIPFGYYEFPVVIVRSNEGGVCEVLHPHKIECEMLRVSGLMGPSATSDGGGGAASEVISCTDVMNRWHRQACVKMFPPIQDFSAEGGRSEAAEVGGDEKGADLIHGEPANLAEKESNVVGYVMDDSARGGHETRSERAPGAAAPATAFGARDVSFEEATRRVDGVQSNLRDLLEAMKIHTNPEQTYLNYFVAHHYPFYQPNGGPLDEVSIIEGYRLSEVDFNRLALSFSCLLSDVTHELRQIETAGPTSPISDRVHGGVGDGDRPGADDAAEDMLILKTTARQEGGLEALVNCSLVPPLHEVRVSLLDHTFEPSETICRGSARPCLDRARAELSVL